MWEIWWEFCGIFMTFKTKAQKFQGKFGAQGGAKGGRQKEFDHLSSFSGLFRSLFGHFF